MLLEANLEKESQWKTNYEQFIIKRLFRQKVLWFIHSLILRPWYSFFTLSELYHHKSFYKANCYLVKWKSIIITSIVKWGFRKCVSPAINGSAVRNASKSRTDIPWLNLPIAANASKAIMSPPTRNATRLQNKELLSYDCHYFRLEITMTALWIIFQEIFPFRALKECSLS